MPTDPGLDTYGLVALAIALCPPLAWWSRRSWRNEAPALDADSVSAFWAWGPRSWRGWVRIQPAALPATIISLVLLLAGGTMSPGPDMALPVWALLSGVVVFIGLAAVTTIMLFNRPKLLVARHLRHHPGYLLELFGRACAPAQPPAGALQADPGLPGPFIGAVLVTVLLGMIVWSCTLALVPALLGALAAFSVSAWIIRTVYADLDWGAWLSTGQRQLRAVGGTAAMAAVGLCGAAIVQGISDPATLPIIGLGALGGMCLAFAGRGFWLSLVDYRARRARAVAGGDGA